MKVFLGIVGFLLLLIGGVAASTGILMLIIGGIHSVIDAVPALGFWQTLPFGLLLGFIGGALSR